MTPKLRKAVTESDVVEIRFVRIGTREIACLLTRETTARILGGVSVDTLDREYKAGRIARVYVSETPMHKLEDVLDYIERRRWYRGESSR